MVMGCTRTLAVASTSSAIISSACIAAGASPVGLRALPALRGGRRFTSVVRADIDLSGSFAGQPAGTYVTVSSLRGFVCSELHAYGFVKLMQI